MYGKSGKNYGGGSTSKSQGKGKPSSSSSWSSQKGDDESYYKGKGWGGDKGSSGKAGWGTEYAAEKGKGWGDYYKGGYGYADDWKQYEPAEDDDENPEYRRRILHKDA